jgi:hypothetical protein
MDIPSFTNKGNFMKRILIFALFSYKKGNSVTVPIVMTPSYERNVIFSYRPEP